MNRADVLQFFASHDWVASLDELQQLGVSRAAVSRARRAGTVVDVAPRVVALAHAGLSVRGRARAGILAAGHEAFVSGPTAGLMYGLREMPRRRIEITVHEFRRVRLGPPYRLVYTSWIDEARDIRVFDGLRVASPLRMLFGLASQFNRHRFERAAEDTWHKGLVEPVAAAQFLGAIRKSGRGGVLRFEEWLQRTDARSRPSQSGMELDVLGAIRRAGLPEPERQYPVQLRSGETIHLDIAWPSLLLAFEPGHTWWHGGDLRQRADEERDQAGGELGWAVHRFDEVQVADASALTDRVAAIYAARLALLSGRRSGSLETS